MTLYQLARLNQTAKALASGDPKRIQRRAKNLLVGRLLARSGVWGRLWR